MPHATYSFLVQGQHAGFNNALKLSGLADFLQIAAWRHAQDLGFGVDTLMQNRNCTWAMTRIRIDIENFPDYNSKVDVKTWPKKAENLSAYRDLQAVSNGMVIAKATSTYVLLDLDSRRPIAIEGFDKDILDLTEMHAIKEHAVKLPRANGKAHKTIEAETTDLDLNLHVNNVRYFDWAQDVMPYNFWQKHDINKVEVNFMAELNAGDKVELAKELQGNVLLVSGAKSGKDAFRVRIQLTPKSTVVA